MLSTSNPTNQNYKLLFAVDFNYIFYFDGKRTSASCIMLQYFLLPDG